MHCHLIFNPKAASGKNCKYYPEIETYLQKHFHTVSSSLTERPAHAEQLAIQAVKNGSDLVVAVGGDGTINEVVNGLMRAPRDAMLGILPGGSCNDFIKSVDIPDDLEEAYKMLPNVQTQPLDVVQVGERYFVNAAGIGFDVNIAERINASPKHGPLAYAKAISNSLFSFKSMPLDILNGKQTLSPDTLMLTIANGQYYGGNFRIAPKANVNDGKFDVILLHDANALSRLGLLVKIVKGTHLDAGKVKFVHSSELIVKTQVPVSIQIEGEVFKWPSTEFHFKMLPKRLNLVVSS